MVFNVDWDSNKGFKAFLFSIILLIMIFLAESVVLIAQGEDQENNLKGMIGSDEMIQKTTLHGHWIFDYQTNEWYWYDDDTGAVSKPTTWEEVKRIAESNDGNYFGNYPRQETFVAKPQDWSIDVVGGLMFFWNLISFQIIPFPFNIFPAIFTLILMLYIGYFIVALISGFIPSWA